MVLDTQGKNSESSYSWISSAHTHTHTHTHLQGGGGGRGVEGHIKMTGVLVRDVQKHPKQYQNPVLGKPKILNFPRLIIFDRSFYNSNGLTEKNVVI